MTDYELSIVIPSRNEEYLNKTIQHILEHKKAKTQIIVGLDGQWPVEPIKDNPDVVLLFYPESIGQRGMTNRCVEISKAKFIMKVDAHCAFDDGFDQKMIESFQKTDENVVMAPVMRNLHIFNWVCPDGHTRYQGPSGPCKECGKPTVKDIVWIPKSNPQSVAYCFDPEPHFQYMNELKNRTSYKEQGDLTESMSLQGSCFMVTREKYWELNLGDEEFGSWGSQGIQIACSFWLSGGKVLINHNTWYAHCFRTQGGDFGFPYPISGTQTNAAKKLAGDKLKENKWPKQIHPSSWLVEKFWPIPHWSNEDLIAIGGTPIKQPIEPSRGVIYYTDNQLDEKLMKACQHQLWKSATRDHKLPIVSCSLKPMDFGKNIVFDGERGYLTMTKQILTALEELDTDIVFFCEHDVLYPPEHFAFTPPDRNTWYYDENYWFLRLDDGFAISYDCSPLSGLVVYRDIAIKHFKERIALMEKDQFKEFSMLKIGFEPMTHGRIKWENSYPFKTFYANKPSIDITHGKNVSYKRWSIDKFRRKPKRWIEGTIDTITGWDNVKRLLA
jgi:glycosyltransferase involved in cell wall biosynthesis